MVLTFIDNNISLTMNAFMIIVNMINILYTIPQMITIYRIKSVRDIETIYLIPRIIINIILIAFAVEIKNLLFLIFMIITTIGSLFIGCYKIFNLIEDNNINKRERVLKLLNNLSNNTTKKEQIYIEEIYIDRVILDI